MYSFENSTSNKSKVQMIRDERALKPWGKKRKRCMTFFFPDIPSSSLLPKPLIKLMRLLGLLFSAPKFTIYSQSLPYGYDQAVDTVSGRIGC